MQQERTELKVNKNAGYCTICIKLVLSQIQVKGSKFRIFEVFSQIWTFMKGLKEFKFGLPSYVNQLPTSDFDLINLSILRSFEVGYTIKV